MKKFIITIVLVGSMLFYVAYTRRPAPATPSVAATTQSSGAPADLSAAIAEQQVLAAEVAALAARVARLEGSSAPVSAVASSGSTPVSKPAPAPTPAPKPAPAPTPAPAPKPAGQYKDGSYTGSVVDAYYGNVQVQAAVSGGRLTNVTFLSYPSDRANSRYINGQAMPILTEEAITAQSANVNIVSGATFTSQAFIQSLSSALASAKV